MTSHLLLPEEDAIHIGPQVVTQDGKWDTIWYSSIMISTSLQNSAHGYVSKKVNHPQLGNILMFERQQEMGQTCTRLFGNHVKL